MKFLVLLLYVFSFQANAAWDLNDVSFLMPLPTSLPDEGLLKISDAGIRGSLIPDRMMGELPSLLERTTNQQLKGSLRVVSVRIDPCFPLPTPESCQRQLRLVWQPTMYSFDGTLEMADASLHTFYVLTDREFEFLKKDLHVWKANHKHATAGLPLQVHPAWATEGANSPELKTFNQLVLRYAGDTNLSRVTVMLLRQSGLMWNFIGFDVDKGALEQLMVPRLRSRGQSFFNSAFPMDHFARGGVAPAPEGKDILNSLVADSSKLDAQSEDTILRETGAAYRIENPKIYNPENMDCVSCHVAMPAIQWVKTYRPGMPIESVWQKEIYTNSRYDLRNTSVEPWNTRSLRAFGYFGKNKSLSQRVINESAEVADALNEIKNPRLR